MYDMPGIQFGEDGPVLETPSDGYKRGFLDLLESGKGMVFMHHAIAGWPAWEEYADINRYENLLRDGFSVISQDLAAHDQVLVDTKFEFGYVKDAKGNDKLIYMDEVGTPDSSRIWDGAALRSGKVVENSKEGFRQFLLNYFDDADILLNKTRMSERSALAKDNALPLQAMHDISNTYIGIAEKIIGHPLNVSQQPKQEIIDVLDQDYGLIR